MNFYTIKILTCIKSFATVGMFGINSDKSFRCIILKFDLIIWVSVGHSFELGVPMIENIRVNWSISVWPMIKALRVKSSANIHPQAHISTGVAYGNATKFINVLISWLWALVAFNLEGAGQYKNQIYLPNKTSGLLYHNVTTTDVSKE